MIKRCIDITCAAVLLLLSMPALLLSICIIRITSPGPVFFRQLRMGRGFQPFEILKLRTMAHAEAGLAYTLGPDPRITPFGKWLRRTKLDELPQLWNVLRGDMSLVGPRPVLPELTNEFRVHYTLLLRQRPGLTDPASLKYSQEARLLAVARDPMYYFKSVVTPDKIRISLEYMDRANLWTDTVIVAMTALVCCFPSLSRLYGEVPSHKTIIMAHRDSPVSAFPNRIRSAREDIYAPSRVPIRVSADEDRDGLRRRAVLPWKLTHLTGSKPESTPQESTGRVLRL